MDLMHFPIDSSGRSLVALAVANATGTGILLTSNRTGVSCDVNSSADTSVPAEVYQMGTAADNEVVMTAPAAEATPEGDPVGGTVSPFRFGSLVFSSVYGYGADLWFYVQITPTGMAPYQDLGALEATVTSGLVLAYDDNDRLISPQPASLPSVNVTETIAEPWETGRPANYFLWSYPPIDYVFGNEFHITFQESDFPSEGYYLMPLSITSTSGGFDDVFAINTARVRFEARTPTLTPFFAVARNILNGPDAMSVNYPGESPHTLPRNASLDYEFEINVYIWSSDTAEKNAAANIVLDELMEDFPSLPSSQYVINDLVSMSSSPPTYGVGYVLDLLDTEPLDGISGYVFVGFAESSLNLAQLEYSSDVEGNWTGTISWNEP
jgi:hypothetical protein